MVPENGAKKGSGKNVSNCPSFCLKNVAFSGGVKNCGISRVYWFSPNSESGGGSQYCLSQNSVAARPEWCARICPGCPPRVAPAVLPDLLGCCFSRCPRNPISMGQIWIRDLISRAFFAQNPNPGSESAPAETQNSRFLNLWLLLGVPLLRCYIYLQLSRTPP